MEEETKYWLLKVGSWKGFIGSYTLRWEDALLMPEAMCRDGKVFPCDGKVLHHDEEKKTSNI